MFFKISCPNNPFLLYKSYILFIFITNNSFQGLSIKYELIKLKDDLIKSDEKITALKSKLEDYSHPNNKLNDGFSNFPAPVQDHIRRDVEFARNNKDWNNSIVGRAGIYQERYSFKITPFDLETIITRELEKEKTT